MAIGLEPYSGVIDEQLHSQTKPITVNSRQLDRRSPVRPSPVHSWAARNAKYGENLDAVANFELHSKKNRKEQDEQQLILTLHSAHSSASRLSQFHAAVSSLSSVSSTFRTYTIHCARTLEPDKERVSLDSLR